MGQQIFKIWLALIFLFSGLAHSADTLPTISAATRTYLEQALDLMQERSLNRGSINWNEVRRATLELAKNAQTTTDTYPAIAYALAQLKEHHSFLQLPDSLSEAQKQSIRAQMQKVSAAEGRTPSSQSPFFP